VVFSGWFFFLVTRLESVAGAAFGLRQGSAGGSQSVFPYLSHQGAGAFLAIAALSLWLARGSFAEVARAAFGGSDRLFQREIAKAGEPRFGRAADSGGGRAPGKRERDWEGETTDPALFGSETQDRPSTFRFRVFARRVPACGIFRAKRLSNAADA